MSPEGHQPIETSIFRFCPKSVEKKLTQIVSQTLQYREDNNIVRNDFLQIIRELKKTSKDYEFTDLDVTAHAAGFFGDGYETSSQVMSFVLYHLAANEDVQMKLRNEINEAFDEKERLPYEVLQTLTYLDGVFNGTTLVPTNLTYQCHCRNFKANPASLLPPENVHRRLFLRF